MLSPVLWDELSSPQVVSQSILFPQNCKKSTVPIALRCDYCFYKAIDDLAVTVYSCMLVGVLCGKNTH